MAKQSFCSECKRKLGSDESDPHVACKAVDDIDRACNQWWIEVNGEGLCYNNTRRVIWRAAIRWVNEQKDRNQRTILPNAEQRIGGDSEGVGRKDGGPADDKKT